MVRGAGAVRIVTTEVDKFASDQPPKVSAKSKIEQAVFFGVKQDNPLIFDGRQDIKFADDEIAAAALEVSHEILSSSTPLYQPFQLHWKIICELDQTRLRG
ncbi:hypothetical protein NXS19_003612 [Fusarium pseudograminearum]|nr:hypothetical protein NXS19_003612 [Fusarium pseudograminearum]